MENNIKIALCFSGEPRYYALASESLAIARQFCLKNNITLHVFCHFWDCITKRQITYKEDNDPIIEYIDEQKLLDTFKPTVGVVDSKDALDKEIVFIWNYIQKLITPIGIPNNDLHKTTSTGSIGADHWYMARDLNLFHKQIKYTNTPPYSQLSSICKSHVMRIEYEKKYDIKYDWVVRLRTDESFSLPSMEKLLAYIQDGDKPGKTIYFPQMWVHYKKQPHLSTVSLDEQVGIGVEYCMFVGTSESLNSQVFCNYKVDIPEILFKLKENGKLYFTNSHNFFPSFLLRAAVPTKNKKSHIRCGNGGFKYKLRQMERIDR